MERYWIWNQLICNLSIQVLVNSIIPPVVIGRQSLLVSISSCHNLDHNITNTSLFSSYLSSDLPRSQSATQSQSRSPQTSISHTVPEFLCLPWLSLMFSTLTQSIGLLMWQCLSTCYLYLLHPSPLWTPVSGTAPSVTHSSVMFTNFSSIILIVWRAVENKICPTASRTGRQYLKFVLILNFPAIFLQFSIVENTTWSLALRI